MTILGMWECVRGLCTYLHTTKPPLDIELPPVRVKTWMGEGRRGPLVGSRVTLSILTPPSSLFLFLIFLPLLFLFFLPPLLTPTSASSSLYSFPVYETSLPHTLFFIHLSNHFISFSPIPSPLWAQNTWITQHVNY